MLNLILVIFFPVITLVFLPIKKVNRPLFFLLSVLSAFVCIGLSFHVELNTVLSFPAIRFILIVDKISRMFLVLISCTWLISILFNYDYGKYNFREKQTQFFLYINILLTVVMINACAGNLTTLFIFYTIGIPLTYPLLNIRNTDESKKAASVFLKQTLIPAFLIFLPAIILTEMMLGNIDFNGTVTLGSKDINPFVGGGLLCMYVIGISKNAVFPFHTWLPGTNSAPAPVSGLIHSVATVKTGSIALMKIAIYIFGLDYIHTLSSDFFTGGWLVYLCGLTAVYTAYKAFLTDDLKQRFTYSTVGQLSYIVLAILVGTKTGIVAGLLHISTHAIAKSCLFYVVGFYSSVYGTVSAKQIGKIIPSTRFIAFVIAVCGLSITGFPFLAGFYSKDLMLIEEWNNHYYASAIFLVLGAVINLFYIIGPVKNAFNAPSGDIEIKPVPLSMMVVFVISILLLVGANFFISFLTLSIE